MTQVSSSTIERQERVAWGRVFRLMGRIWDRELDPTTSELFRDGPISEAYLSLGGIPPGEPLGELAVDYCQLFVGPQNHLPPLQSVWEERQLGGHAAATSVGRFLDLLPLAETWARQAPFKDHLGVELETMGLILMTDQSGPHGETGGKTAGETGQTGVVDEIAEVFFNRHLTWPDQLLQAAAGRAATNFYRGAVKVTRQLLESAAVVRGKRLSPDP